MIDHRINKKYLMGFVGGPAFKTRIWSLRNGSTRRNRQWDMPKHRYTTNYVTLNEAEKEAMLATFWIAGGAHESFRFKDWNDYKVVNMVMAAPATLATPIQLTKTYVFGPSSYVRTIKLPLNATLYFDAGSGPVLFTDYTLNPLTGVATPNTLWPVGTPSWSGQFDVCVRFSNDFNPFTSPDSEIRTLMVELEEDN